MQLTFSLEYRLQNVMGLEGIFVQSSSVRAMSVPLVESAEVPSDAVDSAKDNIQSPGKGVDLQRHPFGVPSAQDVEEPSPKDAAIVRRGEVDAAVASTSGPAGEETKKTRGKTRGRALWDRTLLKVLLSLGVSRQFKTLRDHEGMDIRKKDLQLIGVLGQGGTERLHVCMACTKRLRM